MPVTAFQNAIKAIPAGQAVVVLVNVPSTGTTRVNAIRTIHPETTR